MRTKVKDRPIVGELPANALTVSNYAKAYNNGLGCATSYVYELEKHGKVNIVRWQGINLKYKVEGLFLPLFHVLYLL